MENPNKLYFSVYVRCTNEPFKKRQRDAVGLSLFSDKVNLHTTKNEYYTPSIPLA